MPNQRNIEVKIIADSINPKGQRITSALWTYPRFVHSEVMTHRAFSRNAASSRAIPITKVMQAVNEHPALPEWWGSNKAGMQAGDELDETDKSVALSEWLAARDEAIVTAQTLSNLGLHKQIANRVLEPWFHITVLVTATDWDNFFALRAHPAAQPEFQVLAYRMLDAMVNKSTPKQIGWCDWHIPFDPGADYNLQDRLTVSVAKAARTSYVAFNADKSLEEQQALFRSMRENGHWSPFEHQARANATCDRSGNFHNGWEQYRHVFEDNTRQVSDYRALLATKPDWITL